jgi:hypothetical protein
LLPQGADDQDRSPGGGIQDAQGVAVFASHQGFTEQDALQLGQQSGEEIFATEVGDDALFDLAVLAIGFDDADVLVDGAVGGRDFDGADEQGVSITTNCVLCKGEINEILEKSSEECHYVFRRIGAAAA